MDASSPSAEIVVESRRQQGVGEPNGPVVTLDHAIREGNLRRAEKPDGPADIVPCGRRLRRGDLVVVTTIGGGYLYGAVGFRLG